MVPVMTGFNMGLRFWLLQFSLGAKGNKISEVSWAAGAT